MGTCYSASVSATSISGGPSAAQDEANEDMDEMRVPLAKQGSEYFSKKVAGEEKEGGPSSDMDVEMQRKQSYGTQERIKEIELDPIQERFGFFMLQWVQGLCTWRC